MLIVYSLSDGFTFKNLCKTVYAVHDFLSFQTLQLRAVVDFSATEGHLTVIAVLTSDAASCDYNLSLHERGMIDE